MSYGSYTVRNVGVNIKVDQEGLSRTMVLYVRALGENFEKFFKRQARLLCQDMLDYTVPFTGGERGGRNTKARDQGIRSMERDVDRIFAPLAVASYGDIARNDSFSIFAAWVHDRKKVGYPVPKGYDNGGLGEWHKFQNQYYDEDSFFHEDQTANYSAVYGGSQIEKAHVSQRGGTRIPNYKKSMNHSRTVFLVADADTQLAAYKKKVAKRVGTLKAGWYSAGMAIGDAKVSAPSWIVGNQWGSGIMVNQLSSRPVLSIEVGNAGHELMSVDPGFSAYQQGISHRAYVIREELARRLTNRRDETVEQATASLEAHGYFQVEENPF